MAEIHQELRSMHRQNVSRRLGKPLVLGWQSISARLSSLFDQDGLATCHLLGGRVV